MNTLAYLILAGSSLAGGLAGSPLVLYAAALFTPWLQVMPMPIRAVFAPVNIMLVGMSGSLLTGAAKRPAPAARLPLKKSLIFMTVMLVMGLLIRAIREQSGDVFLNKLADQPIVVWYWVTPFVVYVLVWRLATEQSVAWLTVRLCEVSIGAEGALSVVERASGIGRATAHIGEANRAGAYFAAGSCYFLARFLTARARAKIVYAVAWCLTIAGVFNSLSRGAMVATTFASVFTVGVFFVKGRARGGSKALFVLVAALLLANAAVLVPQRVIDRINSTFRGEERLSADPDLDASSEARLLFWSIAWDTFKSRPLGLGTGTFPTLVEPYWKRPMNAHNIYLQLLTEYGLQGFVALLTLIGTVAGSFYRRFARSDLSDRGDTALSLLGWWIAYSAAHFFVNPFFLMEGNGQFWIMAGCLPHLQGPASPAAAASSDTTASRGVQARPTPPSTRGTSRSAKER